MALQLETVAVRLKLLLPAVPVYEQLCPVDCELAVAFRLLPL
jgi:hypothetical protein